MKKLEDEVFLLRIWKNYAELEECLTLDEIEAIVDARRTERGLEREFLAAIQGVDIKAEQENTVEFDDVKRRVDAKIAGKSEEELAFQEIGIAVETE